MYPSSFRRLVFWIYFCSSFIHCESISRRELKSPAIVWGKVLNYKCNERSRSYELDPTHESKVPLQDLRALRLDEQPKLETDGFTWVSGRRIIEGEDFGQQGIRDKYKAELREDSIKIVKELTKSDQVISFTSDYRDKNSRETKNIIPAIHSDFSPRGAKHFKRELQERLLKSQNPDLMEFGKQMKKGKDVVIYNVWRPLQVVKDNHLGICKWDSLLKEDAIKFKQKIQQFDASNSFQAWRYREGQQWFFLSHQAPDEAYIFMQHDIRAAKDAHGINVPHASFNLEEEDEERSTRISFECRIVAIVDPSSNEGKPTKLNRKIKSFVNQFK